jgi:hypothetical protein
MPSFKHAGKIGDCIYALPAMRALGGGELILLKNRAGHDTFDAEVLVPLLQVQDYIDKVSVFDCSYSSDVGPATDYSFLPFNSHPRVFQQHLVWTAFDVLGLPIGACDPGPWVQANPVYVSDYIVAMTDHNLDGEGPSAYSRVPKQKAVFLGTPPEREKFVSMFGTVAYCPTVDLLQAAQVIAAAKVFIGNPSALLAVAVALGKPCISWPGMLLNATPFRSQAFRPELLEVI